MADFVFNTAKGRVAEFFNRVDANDPATATLKIVVLATSGLETDAVLRDKDFLSDVLSGTTNEVTNTNYARKSLADADIAFTVDDANDRVDLDFADQTWTSVAAGDGWSKLLVCYDPNSSADTAIIPLTAHDFVVTPDGNNIIAQVNAAGFFRAS